MRPSVKSSELNTRECVRFKANTVLAIVRIVSYATAFGLGSCTIQQCMKNTSMGQLILWSIKGSEACSYEWMNKWRNDAWYNPSENQWTNPLTSQNDQYMQDIFREQKLSLLIILSFKSRNQWSVIHADMNEWVCEWISAWFNAWFSELIYLKHVNMKGGLFTVVWKRAQIFIMKCFHCQGQASKLFPNVELNTGEIMTPELVPVS